MISDNATATAHHKRNILLFISFALCLSIFALYRQTLNYDFVYDDNWYIVENPTVSQGLSVKGLRWAFSLSEKEASYYHPLSWLSHMLDVEIYGLKPAGHHFTNIILHCLNTLLLFRILSSLTKNIPASTIVALLFAIHPLNIETVAWVTERKNLLSTFFGFCTILAYKRYTEATNLTSYLVVCCLFLLSLLSKPALTILPLLLLLADFWPLERLQPDKTAAAMLMKRVGEKIPLFFLSVASVLVAYASLRMYGNMLPVSEIPVQLRLANALVAALKYIWKTFAPFGQSMLYPFPASVPAAHWMGSLLLLSLGSFLALRYMKRAPYYFFGWFWFLIALLPVSGLLQGGLWPALADRFAYFPLIGIFIIIGWTAERIYRPVGKPMKICLSGFAFAATLFFMTVTYGQIKTWQSSLSLFQQALIHAPDHYVVNLNYGKALFDNGRVEEAMQYYRKAVALEPRSPKAHRNLANAFMTQNKYEPAILEYRATLELLPATDPSIGQAHFALGDAYEKLKDFENASSEYSKAIQLKPDYIDAYNALGIVLAEQGKIEQAITLFQKALQLKPDDPLLRQNLHYAQKLLRKK